MLLTAYGHEKNSPLDLPGLGDGVGHAAGEPVHREGSPTTSLNPQSMTDSHSRIVTQADRQQPQSILIAQSLCWRT